MNFIEQLSSDMRKLFKDEIEIIESPNYSNEEKRKAREKIQLRIIVEDIKKGD